MKILHILDFTTPAAGTFVVLKEIIERMNKQNIDCHVLLLRNDGVGRDELNDIGATVYYIKNNELLYKNRLIDIIHDMDLFDLVHIHGIYGLKRLLIYRLINKFGIPYMISTHGSLMKRGIESKSKIKKKIYLTLMLRKYIRNASCIHVQSEIEAIEAKRWGAKRTVIISNGVTILDVEKKYNKSDEIRVLYLGRLDIHMKGLDSLTYQIKKYINQLNKYNFRLELVGPILTEEDRIFIEKNILQDKELSEIITISDPIYDNNKWEKYKDSDVFILPSRSECGTPLVLLEAMMIGCPCIITEESYSDSIIKSSNGGLITNLENDNLGKTLIEMCEINNEHRKEMGIRAREYCISKYSWEDISKIYVDEYRHIIMDGSGYDEKETFTYM